MAINVVTNNNTYRIRFTHAGKRYTINHGVVGNKQQHKLMESVAAQIALDISLGQLDTTLAKYKPWAVPESKSEPKESLTPLQFWDVWVQVRVNEGLSPTSVRTRYQPIRRLIVDWLGEFDQESCDRLVEHLGSNVKASTFNERLVTLKKWDTWLKTNYGILWAGFTWHLPKKAEQREKPKPFTRDELAIIQRTAQEDARFTHYSLFIQFLIGTGCRPSEAIGLRWEDVDFGRNQVTISTSLRRADDGSASGKNRVRDKTKTRTARIIPLNDGLRKALTDGYTNQPISSDGYRSLVFTAVNGDPINDEYFRKHIWKPLLKKCNIPYQRPYALRHTLISHLIEAGASLVQAAAIAGHKDTAMVSKVYGHMVNLPTMPEL